MVLANLSCNRVSGKSTLHPRLWITYNEAGVLLEKDHAATQPVEAEVFLEQLEEGRPWLIGEAVHKVADLVHGHRRVDDLAQLRLECGLVRRCQSQRRAHPQR
jgi:hypothetical protein